MIFHGMRDDFIQNLDQLKEIRKELYHSKCSGYFVVKNFLSSDYTAHMDFFWRNFTPGPGFTQQGTKIYHHDRNRSQKINEVDCYTNFFWNYPVDMVTHQVCFHALELKNLIEDKSLFDGLLPSRKGMIFFYRTLVAKEPPTQQTLEQISRQKFVRKIMPYEPELLSCALPFNQGQLQVADKVIDFNAGDLLFWRSDLPSSYMNIYEAEKEKKWLWIQLQRELCLQRPVSVFANYPKVDRVVFNAASWLTKAPLASKVKEWMERDQAGNL